MIRKLWTDEPPKDSGYYWLKVETDKKPESEIVYVARGRVCSMRGSTGFQLQGVNVNDVEGKWSAMIPYPSLHAVNKYEARLKELTITIIDCLEALEITMREPESSQRGSRIAKISNALQFANDAAMHITLGMEFTAMTALKNKRARLMKKASHK